MFDGKVIIVTPWFGEFAGGAEVLAKSLSIGLNRRGIETNVFATCSRSPYDSWWEDYYNEGVYQVYGVETHRFQTNKNTKEKYEKAVINLLKGKTLTEQEKEDFFICGINSGNLVEALKPYTETNFEMIAMPYFQGLVHSVVNHYPGKVSITPCFHNEPQFYWPNSETLLLNSKHIFFNSIEEKEMTIKRYGPKVGRKLVESPVAGVPVALAKTDEDRRIHMDSFSKPYFVYVGRKEKGKNVHLLCEWFEQYLNRLNKNTKLLFVGGGDASLLPKSDPFVDLGVVSEAEKYHLIENSLGLISLSENESFSLVIMEGWLSGVPVVVSANCAVTRGHVRRANGGFYVENVDEFIGALTYLEENQELSKRIALNGKRYASREFSPDRVFFRYLNELEG